MGHVGTQRKPLGFGLIRLHLTLVLCQSNRKNRKTRVAHDGGGGGGGGRLLYKQIFHFSLHIFEYCDSRNNN